MMFQLRKLHNLMLFVKKKKSAMVYSNFIVNLLFRAGFLCKVLAALKLEIILSLPLNADIKGVCHHPQLLWPFYIYLNPPVHCVN